jgi:predicted patatin/cPLA2 family phospholipase
MEALRASAAIPLLSKIVEIDGKKYLDGGIGDSIPVEKMLSLGYDKVIVVQTQPLEYRKEPLSNLKAKLTKVKYKAYPKFVEAMLNRHERYNRQIERIIDLESKKEIFVIRPGKKLNISVMERDEKRIQEVYELGVKEGNEIIYKLKEYLNC